VCYHLVSPRTADQSPRLTAPNSLLYLLTRLLFPALDVDMRLLSLIAFVSLVETLALAAPRPVGIETALNDLPEKRDVCSEALASFEQMSNAMQTKLSKIVSYVQSIFRDSADPLPHYPESHESSNAEANAQSLKEFMEELSSKMVQMNPSTCQSTVNVSTFFSLTDKGRIPYQKR
jgi:hypothetical protein